MALGALKGGENDVCVETWVILICTLLHSCGGQQLRLILILAKTDKPRGEAGDFPCRCAA